MKIWCNGRYSTLDRMNDKWDNGKPKKSWDCAIRYNNPIGEIASDALLAESASGGLNRMQLFQFQALWWVKMFFQRNNEVIKVQVDEMFN